MKIINLLKVLGLLTLVLSVMVGCASTTTEESTQETTAAATPTPSEPSAKPMPMPKAAAPAVSSTSQYTVLRGDNLWNISGKSAIYGDPYQWPLIYKANQDKIKDADLIFPNQVLGIDLASATEVSAAIRHAKTRGSWSLGVVEESDKAYLAQ